MGIIQIEKNNIWKIKQILRRIYIRILTWIIKQY